MQHLIKRIHHIVFVVILLLSGSGTLYAQYGAPPPGSPMTLANAPQKDTANKTNTSDWHTVDARIWYQQQYSQKIYTPDTSVHIFHRRPYSQPWNRDLGNSGSAAYNMLFTPLNTAGPSLGYHVYDIYRYNTDSLYFYNTNRPYSVFEYQLGSKLEQWAHIMHTQNINPRWNIAAQYNKVYSPGYYKIQRQSNDNGNFSTHYKSKNQHYEAFGGVVYNKEQQDENGGMVSDSFLTQSQFTNRETIPVNFQNDAYSVRRSTVTNMMRDYSLLLNHSYIFGTMDTTYNQDSSQYYVNLKPRFSIGHRMQLTSEKHEYKDIWPDSLRYLDLFSAGRSFASTDSVFMRQKWTKFENSVFLNGFLGTPQKPLIFSLGAGNRIDKFTTEYVTGSSSLNIISNYLQGSIKKEALQPGQWEYQANVQFFVTGDAAGNFNVNASVGKDLGRGVGNVTLGFKEQLASAPYSYTIHHTQYDTILTSFNKESITQVYGRIEMPKYRFSAGISNYLIGNYIYMNASERPDQYGTAFNVTEAWLHKAFRFGRFLLDNELVYQQVTGDAPVNLPKLMGRHQFAIESYLFKNALKVATGIEVRYNTAYYADAYSAFFNRYYYQNSYEISNKPQASLFFNFKVKRFRAYLMGDQLNEIIWKNTVVAPGYAAQNAMIRFGFSWVLIN
ncbi:putative porin [Chitinophagaceae bacterium MMS25-I14]